MKDNKIFKVFVYIALLIVIIICAGCIIISTCSFTSNQNSKKCSFENACINVNNFVNKVGNTLNSLEKNPDKNKIKEVSSELSDNTNQAIEYVERLQKSQEESSKNDVMSFVFSMLSSVLVGVCAAFVAKSYNNLQETKNVSEEAKDIAREAKKDSEKVSEIVKDVYRNARNAESSNLSALDEAKKAISAEQIATKRAKEAEESFIKQEKYQKYVLNIQSALIEIAYARFELIDFNKTDAYTHIRRLEDIVKLFETEYNDESIEKVHKDLGDFREFVEKYSNKSFVKKGLAKKIDAKNKNNIDKSVESFIRNIEKCSNIIDNAIKHCEEILDNHAEDLIQ